MKPWVEAWAGNGRIDQWVLQYPSDSKGNRSGAALGRVLGDGLGNLQRFGTPLSLLDRQEKIFGRSGLAIPRSTLAQWVGQTGVQLQALVDALREAVLAQRVVHADETPVLMLAPGEKKTHRAYVWAYCTQLAACMKLSVRRER